MKILIVSGFLGAGKTTFIKELIRQTGTTPVILENEYGDNNIDAADLQQSMPSKEDLKVLEFMEGCVCCTMKDSFVNSVFTVFSSLSPELLVIEPTGVGKLSNILNNLQPLLGEVITMLPPVVVISPEHFDYNMQQWPVLYRDQLQHAGIVVFSKCEQTPGDVLAQVADEVRALNPDAQILTEHYSQKETSWWESLIGSSASAAAACREKQYTEAAAFEQKKNAEAAKRFGNVPDDGSERFLQVSIRDGALSNPGELILFLEDCLHHEFGHVARAKGTICVGEEYLRFDLADGLYIISGSPEQVSQCVVIGQMLDEKKIRKRLSLKGRSARYQLRI